MKRLFMGALAVLLAAPALAQTPPPAVAPTPAKPATQCFWVREIYNYSVSGDEQTVYLRVRNHDIWRLSLSSPCFGLSYKQVLPIRTFGGIQSVCHALDIDLQVRDHGVTQRCFVSDMKLLTPAEVAAIPKRDLP